MDEYLSLQKLINTIVEKTKAHICIHDISGILKSFSLNINFIYQIHSKSFCSYAKKSPKGFQTCIGCKKRTIQKAIREQKMFTGYCYYGLYEVIKPVVINDRVQCIIYIGNLMYDEEYTLHKIHKTCKITKAPEENIISLIPECQFIESDQYYINTANLLDSYIRLLSTYDKNNSDNNVFTSTHWVVNTLRNYIETNYTDNITLKSASGLYYLNPKYIGRLFNKQTGQTFHEYLNKVRLNKAMELLEKTNESILNISMQCGFKNVTYFNRVFLNEYKITPNQYRSKRRAS